MTDPQGAVSIQRILFFLLHSGKRSNVSHDCDVTRSNGVATCVFANMAFIKLINKCFITALQFNE